MALSQVQMPDKKRKGPSKLETALNLGMTGLSMANSIGNLFGGDKGNKLAVFIKKKGDK